MRITLLLLALLFAGVVNAQTTVPVAGSLSSNQDVFYELDIDFGASSSATITVSMTGDSTSDGLSVFIGDMDVMAATGAAGNGLDQGSDPGTTMVNLSLATPTYTGVHQFVLNISRNSGSGPLNFTGSVGSTTLPAGSISIASSNFVWHDGIAAVKKLLPRAITGKTYVDSIGTPVPLEFMVDFGSTSQALTLLFLGSGSVSGDLELFEIMPNGSSSSLGTVSDTVAGWDDAANLTTSSRQGIVRFRVVADTPDLDFEWNVILPATASIVDFPEISISGTIAPDTQAFYLFSVAHGTAASAVMLQMSDVIMGTYDATLIDPDELAINGGATGTSSLDTLMTLPAHAGVHEYVIAVSPNGSTPEAFGFTLQAAVAPGGFLLLSQKTISAASLPDTIFDRGLIGNAQPTGASTVTNEFTVDFGSGSHTADLWVNCEANAASTFKLYELSSGGTPTLLSTLNLTGSSSEEDNVTTSARNGIVTFRVDMIATTATDFTYYTIFDSSVSVTQPSSGGGDDGDDSGCSTGAQSGGWLLLVGLLCAGIVAVRLRFGRPVMA